MSKALTLGAFATAALVWFGLDASSQAPQQNERQPPPRDGRPSDQPPPREGRPGGQPPSPRDGRPGEQPPPPPPDALFRALDVDGDGILSADEIKSASKNMLKLDKNGDGKLSDEELRPDQPPPPFGRGQGQGPGGRQGPGDRPGAGRRGPGDGPMGQGQGDGRRQARMPELGTVLPPFAREEIHLTPDQQRKIQELERDTKERLLKILTPQQKDALEARMRMAPAGPPGDRGNPGGGRPQEQPGQRPMRPDRDPERD